MEMPCRWIAQLCLMRLLRRSIRHMQSTPPFPALLRKKLTVRSLSSTRRKRPIPDGWATADSIQSFDTTFETEPLYPGGKTLALDKSGDLALTGGKDGVAGVFSISQKQVVQPLKAGGSVTAGAWYSDKPVVATSTGAVKVFENGAEVAQIGSHAGAATSLSLHPCGDILASTGVDKSYVLYDLASNKQLTQVFTDAGMCHVIPCSVNKLLTLIRTSLQWLPSRRPSLRRRWQRRADQGLRRQDGREHGHVRCRRTSPGDCFLGERHVAGGCSAGRDECSDLGFAQGGKHQDVGHWQHGRELAMGLHGPIPCGGRIGQRRRSALRKVVQELVRTV